ncbi:MAG TPA: Ig-like domain-containing protein [Longimicrobiaceae bacterium]|nr:Ig-like domain-containing protein [Longimicrobiaceae bacterium]
MRALWGLALLAGCAHIEPPPGGPEDQEGPRLIATRPDSNAVVGAFRDPVVLVFDERVSEQGLEDAVQVSPRTSTVEVGHRGDELRISLRRGWEAGRIYQVSVAPTVRGLLSGQPAEPVNLVFSTGPRIPDTRLTGTAVSRTTGLPEARIRVEAIRAQDSLVYTTATDSAGAFAFSRIPEGAYRVRAFRDQNADRELQSYEARDTARATVAAGAAASVRLRVLQPDSTAPRVASVQPADTALEVRFDDYLDPAQTLTAGQVEVVLPDSSRVPVVRVELGAAGERGETPAPADTTRPGAPAQGERLPSQTLVVRVGRALPPNVEVRVRVRGIRNVNGLSGASEGRGRTPPAAAPRTPAAPPRS